MRLGEFQSCPDTLPCIGHQAASAQQIDFGPVIEGLKEAAKRPAGQDATEESPRRIVLQATLLPEEPLLLRLGSLFEPFLERQVDLAPLLQEIVLQAAVVNVPGFGLILYNPSHMLLLHLGSNP